MFLKCDFFNISGGRGGGGGGPWTDCAQGELPREILTHPEPVYVKRTMRFPLTATPKQHLGVMSYGTRVACKDQSCGNLNVQS